MHTDGDLCRAVQEYTLSVLILPVSGPVVTHFSFPRTSTLACGRTRFHVLRLIPDICGPGRMA